MAVPAETRLAGSGTGLDAVEKLPVFWPAKLEKPEPVCTGVILTSVSDTAPGNGPAPPNAAWTAPFWDVSVTVVGLPPLVVKLAALNPPAAPFAFREPFVITAWRRI